MSDELDIHKQHHHSNVWQPSLFTNISVTSSCRTHGEESIRQTIYQAETTELIALAIVHKLLIATMLLMEMYQDRDSQNWIETEMTDTSHVMVTDNGCIFNWYRIVVIVGPRCHFERGWGGRNSSSAAKLTSFRSNNKLCCCDRTFQVLLRTSKF